MTNVILSIPLYFIASVFFYWFITDKIVVRENGERVRSLFWESLPFVLVLFVAQSTYLYGIFGFIFSYLMIFISTKIYNQFFGLKS